MPSEIANARRWFLVFSVASLLSVAASVTLGIIGIHDNRRIAHDELADAVNKSVQNQNAGFANLEVRIRELADRIDPPERQNTSVSSLIELWR